MSIHLPDDAKTIESARYTVTVEVRVSEWRGRRIVSRHASNGDCQSADVCDSPEDVQLALERESHLLAYYVGLGSGTREIVKP